MDEFKVDRSKELKTYLEIRFREDNHVKYHRYFKEWYVNLTEHQLYYFNLDYKKSLK